MQNQPTESIEQIRRELLSGATGLASAARRVYRWRAAMWWLSVLIAVLGLLLLGDMLLRREEVGLRVLSLLAWLTAVVFSAHKLLRPAWRFSPTPLQVATWIERSRPEYRDQLSTAVELAQLPRGDSRYGSVGFRDSVLRQWSVLGLRPEWRQFLETKSAWQAAAAVAVCMLLLAGVAVAWPNESRLALTRLVMPWTASRWPRADLLLLHNPPAVVARGSELQLEVSDQKPPLPQRVDLQVRLAEQSEMSLITTLTTTQIGDLAVGNLMAVEQAIEVRAVGGDDDTMSWHRIEVVKPPELEDFHFNINPPDYAQRDPSNLVGRRIRVLAGSQVEFVGRFSEPLSGVAVKILSPASAESNATGAIPSEQNPTEDEEWIAHLGADGQELHIGGASSGPLVLNESISWQLLVSTREGLQLLQTERWAIEVVPDEPPNVTLYPAELAELSSDAQLPLGGTASDDLGLTEIVARLQIEGTAEVQPATLPIWQAGAAEAEVAERPINASWDVSDEFPLAAGQRIAVWLEARDSLGQLARSQIQIFEIRDADDLLDSIQNKLNQVLQRVRDLVDSQRRNNQLNARTHEQLLQANKVERPQLGALHSIAQVQRAIARQLSGDKASIAQEISALQDLLAQNRLEDSAVASELTSLAGEIEGVAEAALNAASSATEDVARQAEAVSSQAGALRPALRQSMAASVQMQSDALQALESLMDRLARNESLQQVQRELAQILDQQNALRRDTDQLQLAQLSDANQDEMSARRAALSADQQGLARRLDSLVERAHDLRDAASQDQASLQSQLQRATESLVTEQTSSKMRRATQELRDEQFAASSATQQQVSQLLNDALNELGAGSRTQLGHLQNQADALRDAAATLGELATEQAALAERVDSGDAVRDRAELTRQQADLRQQTDQQASRARQMGNRESAAAIAAAVASQVTAEQSLAQGEFDEATDSAHAAAEQLQQAAREYSDRAEALEGAVQQQQIFQLSAAVGELVSQQEPVVMSFDAISAELQSSTAAEGEAVKSDTRQTASRQEAVRQMLRDVRTRTSKLPTFDWTLEQAELAMSRTVAAAQRYRVDPEARQAAAYALRLLSMADSALQPNSPDAQSDPAQPDESDSSDSTSEQSADRLVPALASLKLLRALQQDINQQTSQLENEVNSSQRAQQLGELAAMQEALGRQLEQLLQEAAATNDKGENSDTSR